MNPDGAGPDTCPGSHGAAFCMRRGGQKTCHQDFEDAGCTGLISLHVKVNWPGLGGSQSARHPCSSACTIEA